MLQVKEQLSTSRPSNPTAPLTGPKGRAPGAPGLPATVALCAWPEITRLIGLSPSGSSVPLLCLLVQRHWEGGLELASQLHLLLCSFRAPRSQTWKSDGPTLGNRLHLSAFWTACTPGRKHGSISHHTFSIRLSFLSKDDTSTKRMDLSSEIENVGCSLAHAVGQPELTSTGVSWL